MTELPQSQRLSPAHLGDLITEVQSQLGAEMTPQDRTHALLQAMLAIGGELDQTAVLRSLTEAAVQLTKARYAGMRVLDEDGGLSEFIPVGFSEEAVEQIQQMPREQGILGIDLHQHAVLRLSNLADHPDFEGFPEGHPHVRTFLSVPLRVRNEVFGSLCLTEKTAGEEFDEADEAVVTALATAAGAAIENARLSEETRLRERWQAASTEITTRLLSGAHPDEVLAYMAEQARRIGGADIAVILLPDPHAHGHLFAEIADGPIAQEILGTAVEIDSTLCGCVFKDGEPQSINSLQHADCPMLTHRGYGPGLLVPLGTQGNTRGVLLLGKHAGRTPFPAVVRRMLYAFSMQAGVALELAEARGDTERLVVLEERDRIAKDLHDVVIQRLFASAMTLMSTVRLIKSPAAEERVQRTIDELDAIIREIRSTIFALQSPPEHQDTSLRGRVLKLAENTAHSLGCHPGVRLDGPVDAAVPDEIGEQLLAVLSEGLTNVARHASATEVHVSVVVEEMAVTGRPTTLTLTVTDNGVGLAEEGRRSGLRNLEQRAQALGGGFTARRRDADRGSGATGDAGSPIGGTVLTWKVPVPDSDTFTDESF